MTRYLLAVALGYALGRLTRVTARPTSAPVDPFDVPGDAPYVDEVDEPTAPPNRSHGYVPGLPIYRPTN